METLLAPETLQFGGISLWLGEQDSNLHWRSQLKFSLSGRIAALAAGKNPPLSAITEFGPHT